MTSNLLEALGLALLTMVAVAVLMSAAVDVRRYRHRSPDERAALRRVAFTGAIGVLPVALACVVTVLALPPFSATWLWRAGLTGRQIAVVPLIGLVITLAMLLVAELTWPRPRGARRRASLESRAVVNVAARADLRLLRWAYGALVGACVLLALVASGPRSVTRLLDAMTAHTAGPFPGWLWTLPVVALATISFLGAELLLRRVAARPHPEGVDRAWDLWLRRRTARRAVRLTALVLGFTLGGLVLVAGTGLVLLASGNAGAAPAPSSTPHQLVGNLLQLTGLLISAAALAWALHPARDPAPTIDNTAELEVAV